MNVAQRLKKIREQKKLSVYKLSEISGISENHIRNIEKNMSQPNIHTLQQILEPMKITLAEFFSIDEVAYYPSDFEKEFLKAIYPLTEKQAAIILELTKNMNC